MTRADRIAMIIGAALSLIFIALYIHLLTPKF